MDVPWRRVAGSSVSTGARLRYDAADESDTWARRRATRDVAAWSLAGQVVAVAAAARAFDAPERLMLCVVFSRFCLYAFDVAYLELQQALVAEGDRNAMQGCETALTGAAELGIATVALSYADRFDAVADVSAAAVVAAGVVFGLGFLAREAAAPATSR